jgi:hypothetical protein
MQVAAPRHLVVIAATALTVTVTGCSGGDESPAPLAQIAVEQSAPAENAIDQVEPAAALSTAIDTMESTGSYRVSGTTLAGSAIDISFKVGVGSTGTVSTGSPVTLVSSDGVVYVTGDPAVIGQQVGADVDGTIAGKWLIIAPDSATGFAIFADGGTFADAVLGTQGPAEMTGVKDVDGVPAVGLLFPDTGGTLWVAASGEPLPLRFEEKGATAGTGVLTFSNFGDEVDITPPAADVVVDVTKPS